ncbi:MAG: hypothetical protein HY675_04990 [Chloroflexi bacterium]|nr:hypothetical protein [Chloroflexota bacterium]
MPVFASLGLSGVGVSLAGSLSEYRAYFLVVTIFLLGSAHYLLYTKSNRNPWNKVIVWGATALVVTQLGYSVVNTLLLSPT